MIERYTRPEMGRIWSEENKFRMWLEVEVAACEAQAQLGRVPKKAARIIRKKAGFTVQRINELVRGKRGVTPETAWLLAQALNTTPEYWINLQSAHDLARSRPAQAVQPLKAAS